jgi:WS/DGAT/MGAT family acyltransferase
VEGDRFAVMAKLHHATIDGAAGAELMKILYNSEPGAADEAQSPGLPRTERVPSPAQTLSKVMSGAVGKPGKFVKLQVRSMRAMGELTRNRGLTGLADLVRTIPNPVGARIAARADRDADAAPPAPENAAPSTPFNGAITPHRRVALRSVPLGRVKAIKASAGALRQYLLGHDALPTSALVAMVPASIRTGAEEDPWTNRVSALFPILPTTTEDPIDRLRQMQKTMGEAKDRFALVPADVLVDYADFAPPALAIRAARMSSRFRLADRMRPPFNVVISNVPGPRHTLYLDTAEMLHYFPVSTIVDGQGLNITVQSYRDTMDFGLVSCRELVPDIEDLADLLVEEIAVLGRATGAAGA